MNHQLSKLDDIPDKHIQQRTMTDSHLLSRTRHFDAFLLLLISVKFSIGTTNSHISFMSLFGGDSVVVLGKEAVSGQCKLIQYNLNIGDVICNRDVDEEPDGITDIVFNGKPCLALAYRYYLSSFWSYWNLAKTFTLYKTVVHLERMILVQSTILTGTKESQTT